jgi:hypothetical protein
MEDTMLPLPHRYSVTSVAEPNVHVRLNSKAKRILEKTENTCLIANSLKAQRTLETAVEVEEAQELKTA